jgi:RimJ/RimL family protein N-acetyltransferase
VEPFVAFYDFRQAAVNRTMPFAEDDRKLEFHLRMSQQAPELSVMGLYVGGQPVAAFWGMASGTTMHLGMMAHAPTLAEHSPGKLLLMEIGRHLAANGFHTLDLTPGGDPWKERFADLHDEVAEVYLHARMLGRRLEAGSRAVEAVARRALACIGMTPADLRTGAARLRRARPAMLVDRLLRLRGFDREFRVYRGGPVLATEAGSVDSGIAVNRLEDLMAFVPGESWQSRDAFLSSALQRLERGESAYTVCIEGQLAHIGWLVPKATESHMTEVGQRMEFPEHSAALYDFYTHPRFRGRGLYRRTIAFMLRRAFSDADLRYAYISVLADNGASRHVIESLGFEYQRSYHLREHFGRRATWVSGPAPV